MSEQVEALREAHAFKPIEGHTPGPWSLHAPGTIDCNEEEAAFGWVELCPMRQAIAEGHSREGAIANNELIAAAPDLQRHLATALQFMKQQHEALVQVKALLDGVVSGSDDDPVDMAFDTVTPLITTYEEATK